MSRKHPYVGLPDRQFWKKDPGIKAPIRFDPVSPPPFQLTRRDKIITAGSCFAQHIARVLSEAKFTHLIAEKPHAMVPPDVAKAHNYGMFSARYGNVYTARQLRQLFQRAYGNFEPKAEGWKMPDGSGVVDPFRPQIQPGGFRSQEELNQDRKQHLAAVRYALENANVLVFTLGLTECWADVEDGAVYPVAPGVAGGSYDPKTTEFKNFDEVETYRDLQAALAFARKKNPKLKIILTVSPVPLNATFEDRHVAVSTTWSKAVLRIAAEKATKKFQNCVYFPSYEIITSPQTRSRYYDEDRREVLEEGVSHVMELFFKHFTNATPQQRGASEDERPGRRAALQRAAAAQKKRAQGASAKQRAKAAELRKARQAKNQPAQDAHTDKMEALNKVLCDEELLDNSED